MLTLRKIERTINCFYLLVNEYPEEIKKNLDEFGKDAKILNDLMKNYIDDLQAEYVDMNEEYNEYLKNDKLNIFQKINMKSLSYFMSKYEELIQKSTVLQKKIDKVELRIMQFKYFS